MAKIDLTPLVVNAQSGDKAARNELMEACYQDLYYCAYKAVQNEELAADITQDSCLEILSTLEKLQHPEAFRVWANRIVYHRAALHFRQAKEFTVEEDENGETIFDRLPDESDSSLPEQIQEDREFRQTMQALLDALPPEQRTAMMLYYYERLSVEQIAQIQDVPTGTVKSRLNYGRKAVKAQVENYERKTGVRLHSLAPLPLLLLFLLRTDRDAAIAGSAPLLGSILGTSTAATASAATVTTTAAGVGLGVKIAAVVAAAAITAGVVIGTGSLRNSEENSKSSYEHSHFGTICTITPEETTPAAQPQIAVGHWESLTNPGMEIEIRQDGYAQISGVSYRWEQGPLPDSYAWSWLKLLTPDGEWRYNAYLLTLSDGKLELVLGKAENASNGFSSSVLASYNRIALFYRPSDYEGYTLVELTGENILDYIETTQDFQFMYYGDDTIADDVHLYTYIRFREHVGSASFAVVDFLYEESEVTVQIDMDSRSGSVGQVLSTAITKDSDSKWEDGRDFNTEVLDLYPAGPSDWIRRPEDHTITVFEATMRAYRVIGAAHVKGYALVLKPTQ